MPSTHVQITGGDIIDLSQTIDWNDLPTACALASENGDIQATNTAFKRLWADETRFPLDGEWEQVFSRDEFSGAISWDGGRWVVESRATELGTYVSITPSPEAPRDADVQPIIERLGFLQQRAGVLQVGADHQCNRIEDAVRGTKAVADYVYQINASTDKARQASINAMAEAADGQSAVKTVVKKAGHVQTFVLDTVGAVEQLRGRAEDIDRIIHSITQISHQTHILALNAAIEAARAGDEGRGFGVVADEIRGLAGSSRTAAEEVVKITSEVTGAIASLLSRMGTGRRDVSDAAEAAEEAMGSLEAIVYASKAVDEAVEEIETITGQQLEGVRNIIRDVDDVAVTAEQAAENLEQLDADIRTIAGVAQQLAARID